MHDLTVASFFSGVGGIDMGLERAGWRTVSFSEIDPYASAVLAERYPRVPNLGDIVALVQSGERPLQRGEAGRTGRSADGEEWHRADLWAGGFPCQDLSVAGKRRGFDGERSVLAFAFLDLVERHRPPAILLENVPGLLSSHHGRDLGTLIRRMEELRYVGAYRVLDARFFDVPQRRQRVFILALDADRHPDPDLPGEILAVGSQCRWHPAKGRETWPESASRVGGGTEDGPAAGASLDAGRVRAADGLAGRLDHRVELVQAITGKVARPDDNEAQAGHIVWNATPAFGAWEGDIVARNLSQRDYKSTNHIVPTLRSQQRNNSNPTTEASMLVFTKQGREHHDDGETWGSSNVSPTLDSIGHAPRTATAVVGGVVDDDPLLPLGLDSHRYRCCGNGVVSNVTEWIGERLRAYLEGTLESAA